MNKTVDNKRKSRNLSEKKRRDQFNNLINELNNLIDPNFSNSFDDDEEMSSSIIQQTANWADAINFDQSSGAHMQTGATDHHHQPAHHGSFVGDDLHTPAAAAGRLTRLGPFLPLNRSSKAASSTSSVAGSTRQRKMDKSSVLKCAMEFLRKHTGVQQQQHQHQQHQQETNQDAIVTGRQSNHNKGYLYKSQWKPGYITDDEFSVQMLEALDAFIVVCEVSSEARIIYSSDTLTNLLNYTGTCNSLRHYDYVSLFDLVAPQDRAQIEKVFKEQSASMMSSAGDPMSPAAKSDKTGKAAADEYISLGINFRHGLNLSEIKLKRLQQKFGVLRPHGGQNVCDESAPKVIIRQESSNCLQEKQQRRNSSLGQVTDMQIPMESEVNRSQQSIAEQQQHLLSDGRREEQEHNQQHQQEAHLRRQVAEMMQVDPKQLSSEDQQSSSDSSSGGDLQTVKQQQQQQKQKQQQKQQQQQQQQQQQGNYSGTNSEENDQPSSTGSDDASDSNQSRNRVAPAERRHHYRHHHHHQHHHHHHHHHHQGHRSGAQQSQNPKKQSASGRQQQQQQQYELVRLMAIFKGIEDNHLQQERQQQQDSNSSLDRYKFEEPPPSGGGAQVPASKSRYFICIGRLDVPRLSYDLKIIVPPMRNGTNVFHNNQFISKQTLKWRFLWVDNRAPSIIGYLPFEVLGTSGYDYYHWDDLDKLVISHETLMRDGQASSGPYRFLTKGQQWIWLQTKYCIILKPQYYAEQKKKQRQQQQQQQRLNSLDEIDEHEEATETTIEDGPLMPAYYSARDAPPAGTCEKAASQQRLTIGAGPTSNYRQQQQQQHPYGGGNVDEEGKITYTTVYGEQAALSVPKRFRSNEHPAGAPRNGPQRQESGSIMANRRPKGAGSRSMSTHDLNDGDEDGEELSGAQATGGLGHGSKLDKHLEEQRRYEKLLKSNDLIKSQSIKAGNSFSSRSLDQFKFILCTHTVIGFDENDNSVNNLHNCSPVNNEPSVAIMDH